MLSSRKNSPVHPPRPIDAVPDLDRYSATAAAHHTPSECCLQNTSDVLLLLKEKDLASKPLKLQMPGLLDTADLASLTWLLSREDAKLTELDLNLSSRTDPAQLTALLALLPKHPELRSVRFCVDGQEQGPFPPGLREALARSKSCLIKGGVALRQALFRQLDDRLNAIKDTTTMWAVAAVLDDFCRMRLDDASSLLDATSAKTLRSYAVLVGDGPLRLAVEALLAPDAAQ